jgi:hypothetical protein
MTGFSTAEERPSFFFFATSVGQVVDAEVNRALFVIKHREIPEVQPRALIPALDKRAPYTACPIYHKGRSPTGKDDMRNSRCRE